MNAGKGENVSGIAQFHNIVNEMERGMACKLLPNGEVICEVIIDEESFT
jgi:hypothetical protein